MTLDPVPEASAHLARDRWSAAHGGIDPDASRWISGWLSLTHRLARPLAARRVPPGLITLAGVLASVLVLVAAAGPGAWPIAAAALAVVAGVLDGLDGAVARMTGRDTAWGGVVDELADRVSDLLLLAALWAMGAPLWACLPAGVLTLLLESLRSSARVGGMDGAGVITVWERPSRIIVVTTAGLLCGLARLVGDATGLPAGSGDVLAAAGSVVALALAAWSTGHLAVVARRRLGVRKDRRAR